jgi:antitoxin CcdA
MSWSRTRLQPSKGDASGLTLAAGAHIHAHMNAAAPRVAPSRKAPTKLSLRIDLVQRAKSLELDLSEVAERALERAIVEAEQARWLAENAAAIDYYNAFVEEHGCFREVL